MLNLSNNRLKGINYNMFQGLDELITLDLSGNSLKVVDRSAFKPLKSLLNLDLSRNPLDMDLGLLEVLGKLKTLDIRKNDGCVLKNLKNANLRALSMSDVTEIGIVDHKFDLKYLVHLDISGTKGIVQGGVMRDNLENSRDLAHLNTSNVKLNKLNIKYHPKLQVLDASHNHLKQIDFETFLSSERLQDLDLSWNEIERLPGQIFIRTKLVRLNLENNQFNETGLINVFQLPNLETLILSNNKIKVLDTSIFSGLIKLVALYLNGNQIKTIEDRFFNGFSFLRLLDLGNNQLTKLDRAILSSTNLVFLYLDNNRLKTVSKEIIDMKHLIILYLHCNDIVSLPEDIFNIPDESLLKTVTINNNPWHCGCLNNILASQNNIQYIHNSFSDGKSVSCIVGENPDNCTQVLTNKEMYYWRMNNMYRSSVCRRSSWNLAP